MTSVREGLHAAALILEEDLRKIDAGETKATPEQRAFLAAVARGLKLPGGTVSGGFPVDSSEVGVAAGPAAQEDRCLDGGRPENTGLGSQ